MDRVYEFGVVGTIPSIGSTASLGYPVELGKGITNPGPWWFYMVAEELRNVILSGGEAPAGTKVDQVSNSIGNQATNRINTDLVANSVPSYTQTNTWLGANHGSVLTLQYAQSLAINLNLSNNFLLTLGGSCALSTSYAADAPGQIGFIAVQQTSALGNLTFSSDFKFMDNVVPTNTKVDGALDLIVYQVVTGSLISCIYYANVK